MPSTGHTKNLDAGRTEALRGLLGSLGHHPGNSSSTPTALSPEQLQKLSQKINEVLGDGINHGTTPGEQASELLSEDGLPIIDISEPIDEVSQSSDTLPPSVPEVEQDLVPLSLLSADEREQRRRERDRILDLLEEEEHLDRLREEREEEEERQEAIRRRKESVKTELDRLKATRELHKRMGRALIQGTGEDGQEEDSQPNPRVASSSVKKSVSFADAPASAREEEAEKCEPDWGDIVPGRLRPQGRASLVSTAQEYPMKMHVVERRSMVTPASPSRIADSDDESISSTGRISPSVESESPEEDGSSSSDNSNSDDELLEQGFDYDTAQHHREIALEYHKKRHAIGAETAKVMAGNTLNDLERHESSPLSRFRADRMAAAYDRSHGPFPTSLGHSVIPASRQESLRSSVRLGKLEDDQLVGGQYGESGSEDENVREMIQMLQLGKIQNVGPEFSPPSVPTAVPSQDSDDPEPSSVGSVGASSEAKLSRFKLARGGGHTQRTTFHDGHDNRDAQSRSTISGVIERKVPRSAPSQHFPVCKPPPRPSARISEPTSAMITDSPLLPVPSSAATVTISSTAPTLSSSFVPRSNATRLERPPSVRSSVTLDSTTQPSVSTLRSPSGGRPVSKFMAEKKS